MSRVSIPGRRGARTPACRVDTHVDTGFIADLILGGLRIYKRWLSPLLPSACRFHPTCSEYMIQAVETHGAVRGIWLGLRRLAKCHPFHQGGVDPVR